MAQRPAGRGGGEERKTGGILGEFAGDGIVVGLGINVSLRADELPAPTAGSLALAGAVSTDRETLLRAVLRSLEDWYGRWKAADGDAAASGLQAAYAAGCATLDRTVRAELPGVRPWSARRSRSTGTGGWSSPPRTGSSGRCRPGTSSTCGARRAA